MRNRVLNVVSYTSKAGNTRNYKVIKSYYRPEESKNRLKLQSFTNPPVEFWVDKADTGRPISMKNTPHNETRQCWECGCLFSYADCIENKGNWSEYYCGC